MKPTVEHATKLNLGSETATISGFRGESTSSSLPFYSWSFSHPFLRRPDQNLNFLCQGVTICIPAACMSIVRLKKLLLTMLMTDSRYWWNQDDAYHLQRAICKAQQSSTKIIQSVANIKKWIENDFRKSVQLWNLWNVIFEILTNSRVPFMRF